MVISSFEKTEEWNYEIFFGNLEIIAAAQHVEEEEEDEQDEVEMQHNASAELSKWSLIFEVVCL